MVMVQNPTEADVVAETQVRRPLVRRVFDRPDGRIAGSVAVVVAASWVVVWAIVGAMAPTPDPDAVLNTFDVTMQVVFTLALLSAAFGLALRARLGVMASIAGGLVFMAGSISCWMGGHVGTWIAVQFVGGAALAGLSAVVLQRD